MAKGIGLIGNFRGKVGNMVGYNLKDSNNKQTQGVRVYQPVVKNPKTSGQAEQRAKLAPINATYRALKAIIDRGQEGKAYGNKSRLAWLSDAMKAFNGGWYEKGSSIKNPALVPLTKGSLNIGHTITPSSSQILLQFNTPASEAPATVGALSTHLLADGPFIKAGDQITFVGIIGDGTSFSPQIVSIVIDTTDTTTLSSLGLTGETTNVSYASLDEFCAGTIILSREGDGGQHLRSTTSIMQTDAYDTDSLAPAAKAAAIKSYMAAGANTDWAEESLQ